MAEILALAATIAGLVDLASRSAMGLRTAYQTMEDAPVTIQRLSRNLDAFHAATETLLSTLQSFQGKGLVLQVAPFDHMVVAIENGKHTLQMVRKKIKLEEVESSEVGHEVRLNWMQRFRFLVSKGGIEELLVDLERDKSTLNISIQILAVQILVADRYPILNAPARRRTTERIDQLTEKLQTTTLEPNKAIIATGLTEEPEPEIELVDHEPKAEKRTNPQASDFGEEDTEVATEPTIELGQKGNPDSREDTARMEPPVQSQEKNEPTSAVAEGDVPNKLQIDDNNMPSSHPIPEPAERKQDSEGQESSLDPIKQFDFLMAVMEGNVEDIKHNIRDNGRQIYINEKDPTQGLTPVALAVTFSHNSAVEALITAGADVDIVDNNGFPPLAHAMKNGNLELMGILLKAGADTLPKTQPNWHIYGRATYLTQAIRIRRRDMAELLLDYKVNPNDLAHIDGRDMETGQEWVGSTSPLMAAILWGDVILVRRLLDANANPNTPAGCQTPLLEAVAHLKKEIFELLLERGADPDLKHWNRTARGECERIEEFRKILFRREFRAAMNSKVRGDK